MDTPTTYRIEIRGEAGARVLRPFVDAFDIRRHDCRTTLVGDVTDVAHRYGLFVRPTSRRTATGQPRCVEAPGPGRS